MFCLNVTKTSVLGNIKVGISIDLTQPEFTEQLWLLLMEHQKVKNIHFWAANEHNTVNPCFT